MQSNTHSCLHLPRWSIRFGSHIKIPTTKYFYLTPHQSREDSFPPCLLMDRPAQFTAWTFGNKQPNVTHRRCSVSRPEKDFLVTERIWFPCRNLGKQKSDSFKSLARLCLNGCWTEWWTTHSVFILSRAEKGPFMSSMVHEISLFWRSLLKETKKHHAVIKSNTNPHPKSNRATETCFVCERGKRWTSKWLCALIESHFLVLWLF